MFESIGGLRGAPTVKKFLVLEQFVISAGYFFTAFHSVCLWEA